jgi:hypothetical protein
MWRFAALHDPGGAGGVAGSLNVSRRAGVRATSPIWRLGFRSILAAESS